MMPPGTSTDPSKKADPPTHPSERALRKTVSYDTPLRWLALGMFLAIMVPFILNLIILIAAKLA